NIGNENHMSFYIEEEQKQSEITISIIEETSGGLLGGSSDIVKENIRLTYDYRTGRWMGDDYFKDDDGYGHYLGDTYEVWFNMYQSDYDHDGIPYWIEVNVLGTDPTIDDSQLDPDNDGIPTSWEWKWGYDPFTWDDHENLDPDVDGLSNIEEYKMRKRFANPNQPEIFIEVDGMKQGGIFDLAPHKFPMEAGQMLIERFAQHGIWTYIDNGEDFWRDGPNNGGGEQVPYHQNLDDVTGKESLSFYKHYFADERKGIFRYMIMGVEGGFTNPCFYNTFDTIIVGTGLKDSVLVRGTYTPRAYKVGIAKVALHELGHSLGLVPVTFPGNDILGAAKRYPSMPDEEYEKYLNQYYSIMNYQYIYRDKLLFDFSDGSNGAPYDQNDWVHLYLPAHRIDMIAYEEPVDESFEDFEVVDNYPGVILEGWAYDTNLTDTYELECKDLAIVKNTDVSVQLYVKNKPEGDERNLRVYAMPDVYPTHAQYSLIAEGRVTENNTIQLYNPDEYIESIHPLFS
ncbi:MAG: hypothetical protein KGY50_03470, partial [Candidatus Thermoplasmatota archaeon]|nr:hypothetical protein [Candidatus Thermoplasmatota archaeon]